MRVKSPYSPAGVIVSSGEIQYISLSLSQCEVLAARPLLLEEFHAQVQWSVEWLKSHAGLHESAYRLWFLHQWLLKLFCECSLFSADTRSSSDYRSCAGRRTRIRWRQWRFLASFHWSWSNTGVKVKVWDINVWFQFSKRVERWSPHHLPGARVVEVWLISSELGCSKPSPRVCFASNPFDRVITYHGFPRLLCQSC